MYHGDQWPDGELEPRGELTELRGERAQRGELVQHGMKKPSGGSGLPRGVLVQHGAPLMLHGALVGYAVTKHVGSHDAQLAQCDEEPRDAGSIREHGRRYSPSLD